MKNKMILGDQKGFTLIELLVSIVIVTIVIGIITSYFLAANRISLLEQDQRDAQSEVRLAMDSILKEARYATSVEVVSVTQAALTTGNAIYISGGAIVFRENGSVLRELNGSFVDLTFTPNGRSIVVDLKSTYRGQTYSLPSTFQLPNIQLIGSVVSGSGIGNAIRYNTTILSSSGGSGGSGGGGVTYTSVTGITLSPSALTLNAGGTSTLIATVSPPAATNKKVIWSNPEPGYVTLTDEGSGIANIHVIKKNKTVTITARTEDGGYTATCTITIPNK